MALVNLPTAQLKFSFKDASGSIGHLLIHVPYATLAAVAITAADTIEAVIVALSGCATLGYTLTYGKVEDAPAVPAAGSRVEDKGVFQWLTADGRKTSFSIPGILNAVLNQDGSVNRANLDVIAMVAVVEDVGAIFAGASGSDIVSLFGAYQRFSSTTKKQLPSNR